MTLRDTMHGTTSVVPLFIIFALFAILSIVFLTGHGAGLIAGYNTSKPEQKALFNEKKLCRVMGIGMAVIAVAILIMAIGIDTLPSWFTYVFLGIVLVDVFTLIILSNTICRK